MSQIKSKYYSENLFLAKNIRFLREGLGMSQEELADNIAVGRDNVGSYERSTVPKLHTLLNLSKLFAISINDLSEFNLDELLSFTYTEEEIILKEKEEHYQTYGIEQTFKEIYKDIAASAEIRAELMDDRETLNDNYRLGELLKFDRIFSRSSISNVYLSCIPKCRPNSKYLKLGLQNNEEKGKAQTESDVKNLKAKSLPDINQNTVNSPATEHLLEMIVNLEIRIKDIEGRIDMK